MLVPRVLGATLGPARAGLVSNVGLGSAKAAFLAPAAARATLAATRFGPSTTQLRWRSAGTPASSPRRHKLGENEWPWYPVEPPGHADTVETERVIYSRPSSGNPRAAWAFVIVWLCGVSTWFIMPTPQEAINAGHLPTHEPKNILGLPEATFWEMTISGMVTVTTVGLGLVFYLPTRIITRLSLVRSRAAGAAAEAAKPKQFIRLRHVGHDMAFGPLHKSRDLPVDHVHINLIMGKPNKQGERTRNGWLSLRVAPSKSLLDRGAYRMDFRDTENLKHEAGEVVLSTARIEDVFGPLKPVWGDVTISPAAAKKK
ncbi:hypothetical protein Q8F55_002202 [Vanrija albida]|uniref:Mitochondrial import inner membrane translocase subunit Tim21 n=1 Tax=Vanrija albida TaxID=181172 RepID=A0ABR3Q942_9TREE